MSKLTDIQYRIDQLDGGAFQNLCDAYLTCKGYGIGYSLGMKTGTNKTAKGNPDTYFLKKDGKYVFVMYTTQKDDFVKKALKDLQDQLREKLNLDSKLLDIAKAVEEAALSDDYFKERGLYPNIDFYSGVILTALKIPVEMFTPIFVIGRTPGWIAQWAEFKRDPKHKIARPRQLYTGK